jgi:hypothetical protein
MLFTQTDVFLLQFPVQYFSKHLKKKNIYNTYLTSKLYDTNFQSRNNIQIQLLKDSLLRVFSWGSM